MLGDATASPILAKIAADLAKLDSDDGDDVIKYEREGIKIKYDKAKALADDGKTGELISSRALDFLTQLVASAQGILQRYDTYKATKTKVQAEIAALKQPDYKSIEKDVQAIEAKLPPIDDKATKERNYKWATDLLNHILADCATAKSAGDKYNDRAKAEEKIKQATDKMDKKPDEAIAAVKKIQASLTKRHGKKSVVQDHLAKIEAAIVKAEGLAKPAGEADPDFAEAKKQLEEATALCMEAYHIGDRHSHYYAARDKVTPLYKALKGDPEKAAISDRLGKIKDAIKDARTKSRESPPDHVAAMALLSKASDLCGEAKTKAEMAAKLKGDSLDPDALKALAAEPGGGALLDEMVEKLGEDAKRPILMAAMEARFGLDLKMLTKDATSYSKLGPDGQAEMDKKGKNIKRIYDLMKKVPRTHSMINPKLATIERHGGDSDKGGNADRGSYYQGRQGLIVLSCGRTKDDVWTTDLKTKQANELGTVDAGCEPDDTVDDPPYFDFTTLHEVGHAVDDKMGFMDNRLGDNVAYGGWKEYGGDVAEIATALKTKYDYDLDYIKEYLKNGKATPVPAPGANPSEAEVDAWNELENKVQEWCDAVRVGESVWKKEGVCQARKIGDRVYHEAYGGSWVSYKIAARTKGVSGYQFRAPGEWFAELYAAYHSGKIDSHPAASWLKDL